MTARLARHYAAHGESVQLRAVEDALSAEWASTRNIAAAAGVSASFTAKALLYLFAERRASRRRVPLSDGSLAWRWEWKAAR